MKNLNISLNSVEKVRDFVKIIACRPGRFDLSSDKYVIDAKSIMGIFSLDLGKPLRLDIYNDSGYESLVNDIKDFII